MKISKEKIQKLREIYRKHYGEKISFEEAEMLAEYLVRLVRVVYQI